MREVGIVPHTHWDREWYAPFQTLPGAARAPRRRPARPARGATRRSPGSCSTARPRWSTTTSRCGPRPRPALRRARRRRAPAGRPVDDPHGRVHGVGRDDRARTCSSASRAPTQLGGRRCAVGYLPDMFGHVAQMPQILRLAGLEHAVVWRGVPAAVDRTAFWWRAPDGSTRARRVPLRLVLERARPARRSRRSSSRAPAATTPSSATPRSPGGGMLLMNGSDHLPPAAVARATSSPRRTRRRTTTASRSRRSPSTSRAQPTDGLPTWCGELRSGRARQRAHGRGVEPRRRAPGRAPPPSARSSGAPSRSSALFLARRRLPRTRCSTSAGATWSSTARTTRRARAAPTRSSRRCGCATRRRATSARRSPATRSRTLADDDRRAAGVDHRRQPAGARSRAAWSSVAAPRRRARCTSSRSTTAPRARPRSCGTDGGRGHLHRRRRPEDPLGARDDARSRARRRAHRPGRATHDCDDGSRRVHLPRRRARRARARPRGARKAELLALGEAGATIAIRQRRAPVREVRGRDRPGARLRLAHVPRGRRATGPATAVRAEGHDARQRARPGRGRPRRRHAHRSSADGVRRRRRQPLRRRRRRRRHLQLLPARRSTPSSTGPSR